MKLCWCLHYLLAFLFVKLLVTFSMSMYIMCVIMLVQRFEPQGRRLTNLHCYVIIRSFFPSFSKISSFVYIPMVQNLHLCPQCTQGVYFWDSNPSLLIPVPPTEGRHSNFHKDNFSFKAIIICVWHDLRWFLKIMQKTKQVLHKNYTSGRYRLTQKHFILTLVIWEF